MAHQSGITTNKELQDFFAASKDDVRLIQVSILNEELCLSNHGQATGTWEEDYDSLVSQQLQDKQPCYILYRLDTRNAMGFEWIFITYSPDNSPVRQKMLYASTRSTLKKEFGGGQVKEELFGTVPGDISLAGYNKHLVAQHAPAPLTFAEEELSEIKKTETTNHISVDTKHQTVQGINFPIATEAYDCLRRLQEGSLSYVQLKIDTKNETIELASCEDTDVHSLSSRIPQLEPRYHFLNYKHTHEGDYMETIVFLYTMPGYKCPVKQRMLYSSCKAPLLEVLERDLGIVVFKKIEFGVGDEVLNEEFINNEVHPPKNVARQAFAKPKGPNRRGPRRMVKPNEGTEDGSQ